MIWVPEDKDFQVDRLIHRNSNDRIWTEDISKIEVCSGRPNTLCAWITGCEFFEHLDNKTISLRCTELLRRFLNDKSIPEPTSLSKYSRKINKFQENS